MRAVAREAAHYRGAPRAATVLFALIIVFTGHCLFTAAGKVGQNGLACPTKPILARSRNKITVTDAPVYLPAQPGRPFRSEATGLHLRQNTLDWRVKYRHQRRNEKTLGCYSPFATRSYAGRNDWKASQVGAGIKITNKAPVSIYIHSMKRAS